MKECVVKTKQQNKNSWYLFAVSVAASECLCLLSPRGAPGLNHSLLRPPGQTSVMTHVAICLQVSLYPRSGAAGGCAFLSGTGPGRVGVARWAACVWKPCVDAPSCEGRLHRAGPWGRPHPFVAAFHPAAIQWGGSPFVNLSHKDTASR